MNFFLNPSSILTVFIASALGFYVAPHLELVSRVGARAMRFAAWTLALGLALNFATPLLMNQLSGVTSEALKYVGPVVHGAFWGFLAWSLLGVIQSAPSKGVL